MLQMTVPQTFQCPLIVYFFDSNDAAAAETQKADMIVIATHGATGWQRLLFGSVAEKVVRLASCPVLTIRKRN